MIEAQNTINLEPNSLLEKVYEMKAEGFRLVQINCTMKDGDFEINYTFDKNYEFQNIRLNITQDIEISSISGIYWPAFIYENEMKELFGVKVKFINIDYQGHFYKKSLETPFNTAKKE